MSRTERILRSFLGRCLQKAASAVMSSVATASWVDVPYAVNHRAACYFRGGFNSCAVRGDSLYVFGDLDILYEFSFERKTWSVVPCNGDAPKPRQSYAGFLHGDCFFVFGGSTSESIERDFIQYDFATRTWSIVVVNTGKQPAANCRSAAVLHANSMYSLPQGPGTSKELCRFQFDAKAWTAVTATGQPPPRWPYKCISRVVQNKWVLVGGQEGYDQGYIFDFDLRSWSNFAITAKWGLPQALDTRLTVLTVAHSNSVLVFGGHQNNGQIYELDVEAKSWFPVCCSNSPPLIRGFVGGVYNDNVVVFEPRTYESVGFTYKKLQLKSGVNLDTTRTSSSKGPSPTYLKSLVDKPKFSDVTFKVEGTEIFGHKNLCMRYESFKTLIQVEGQDNPSPTIEITDISRATFLLVLEYVYSGHVDVSSGAAIELFVAADRFEIETLKQLCANKVRQSLTVETAAEILKLADKHHAVELQNECAEMIIANFEVVSRSQAFQDLLLTNASLVLEIMKRR